MVNYAGKRRLGEKPKTGLKNRQRSDEWYERAASKGMVEGEAGNRLIGRVFDGRAILDYQFATTDDARTRFPDLWGRLEERLREAGADQHAVFDFEDARNRRWLEPVFVGQHFKAERDYVILERRQTLAEDVQPAPRVRPPQPSDLDELFAVRKEAFPQESSRKGLEEEIATSPWWGVVEEEGKLAGFAQVGESDGVAWLEGIAVAPEFQRRGIGDDLLIAALAWARDNLPGPMRLHTDFWRNEAMGLYKKHGFSQLLTGVQFKRSLDPEVIAGIIAGRTNVYTRFRGYR
ncbi:MAG: GNAT family N-acetyltransferase [Dehalococcoidia bacterium]